MFKNFYNIVITFLKKEPIDEKLCKFDLYKVFNFMKQNYNNTV